MDTDQVISIINNHWKKLVAVVVILLVIVLTYSTANGLYNTGVQQEQRLDAQYLDNQNYLSQYILGFHEQVGIAQASTTALDQVLSDAVKGRYENTSAGGGYQVNSPFFNAIVEAYPEKSTAQLVASWQKIQDYISSGREGYRNTQSKLLDMLRVYDTWRNSGIIQSVIVRILGYPSNRLIARIGENNLYGQAALDKMYQIVLTKEGLDAYNNGVQNPLVP